MYVCMYVWEAFYGEWYYSLECIYTVISDIAMTSSHALLANPSGLLLMMNNISQHIILYTPIHIPQNHTHCTGMSTII